jgi:hypothetical protein
LEDALAAYLAEVTEVSEMLDGRYDDIKSGRVKPIDGEAFFDSLRTAKTRCSRSTQRPTASCLSADGHTLEN